MKLTRLGWWAALACVCFQMDGRTAPDVRSTHSVSDFEDVGGWKPHTAEGVGLRFVLEKGVRGNALGLHFDFTKAKGWAIAAAETSLDLPENFKFTFYVKGRAWNNTLEFKMVDDLGNTYWKTFPDFSFPKNWKKVTIRREDIVFAWGPAPGQPLRRLKNLEIAVSCGRGGKGEVLLDELQLDDIPPSPLDTFMKGRQVSVTASGYENSPNFLPKFAVDNDMGTRWKAPTPQYHWLQLDLGKPEEIGGLMIFWEGAYASAYDVLLSPDGKTWQKAYATEIGDGRSDLIYFPRKTARYVRIDCREAGQSASYSIHEVKILPAAMAPLVTASHAADQAGNILDGNPKTFWTGRPNQKESVVIDYREVREFGGFTVFWGPQGAGKRTYSLSEDRKHWEVIYDSTRHRVGEESVLLDGSSGRYLKIEAKSAEGVSIRDVVTRFPDERRSNLTAFQAAARQNPAGFYPRWVNRQQEYWTVIGVPRDMQESLLTEDGVVEPRHDGPTLSPFLRIGGRLLTYAGVKTAQSLEEDHLPLPSVRWQADEADLVIDAFAAGKLEKSSTYLRYTVVNKTKGELSGSFYLALRPFQAVPPWMTGGLAQVETVEYDARSPGFLRVNGENALFVPQPPDAYGTSAFGRQDIDGDIVEDIAAGRLSGPAKFEDPEGLGSAALRYDFRLPAGGSKSFYFTAPLHGSDSDLDLSVNAASAPGHFQKNLEEARSLWKKILGRIRINIPDGELINTLKSNVAYILINSDDCRLQPGSRNYEKSWMRDGSVIAAALLRSGLTDEVKCYVDWISGFVREDGWVPFIVDNHDQIVTFGWNEYDSQGEYLFTLLQYYLYSRDADFLAGKKQKAVNAIRFLMDLRAKRKTAEYQQEGRREFYGLFPESASHEGYADHPRHSYWDVFWGIRGLKDAEKMFQILGDKEKVQWARKEREDFQKCFYDSIDIVTKKFNIRHIPGCADVEWPDPTATAAGVWPGLELDRMPRELTLSTFQSYWATLGKRALSNDWAHGDFTPYEIRIANAFLLTGQRERAYKMLKWFMDWKRPRNWNHWAEVVVSGYRSEHYLGDIPHTWVAAEYVNALRNLLIVEDGDVLRLGEGIVKEWLEPGQEVSVEEMPTEFGTVSYKVLSTPKTVEIEVSGKVDAPRIVFAMPPLDKPRVTVNGKDYRGKNAREIELESLPAKIIITR